MWQYWLHDLHPGQEEYLVQDFLYIKILVSEQGNTICEKTVEFSQIVDYEERQKGLS